MNRSEFSVLIVDDEPNIRSGLQKGLVNEADRIETLNKVWQRLKQVFTNW